MAIDYRMMCGFFSHPKTLTLWVRHGSEGVIALQMLWEWAAQYRTSGVLSNISEEDILLACRMLTAPPGLQSKFIAGLVDIRWLDVADDGTYSLHNWEVRQPWVFRESERKKPARENAKIKWEKRRESGERSGPLNS